MSKWDSSNKYRKKRYNSDPEYAALCRKRTKNWRIKQKELVMNHYTKGTMKCQCYHCNIYGINFLTIEHKNGGGTQHRKTMKETSLAQWIVK